MLSRNRGELLSCGYLQPDAQDQARIRSETWDADSAEPPQEMWLTATELWSYEELATEPNGSRSATSLQLHNESSFVMRKQLRDANGTLVAESSGIASTESESVLSFQRTSSFAASDPMAAKCQHWRTRIAGPGRRN